MNAARITDPAAQGAQCRYCGATAVACVRTFRAAAATGTPEWCCTPCRLSGPPAAHVIPNQYRDTHDDNPERTTP